MNKLFESKGGVIARFQETKGGSDANFERGNEIWAIDDIQVFPPNPRLAYEDLSKTNKAKDQVLSDAKNFIANEYPDAELKITGQVGRAGILVIMKNITDAADPASTDSEEKFEAYLKITTKKADLGPLPIFWQTTEFCTFANLKSQNKALKKAGILLDPADIINPGQLYSVDEVITVVGNKTKENETIPEVLNNAIVPLLRQVQMGAPKLIPELTEYRTTIEVKLGEIAAPIALATGHMCSGQYEEAEKALLEPFDETFTDATHISFPKKGEKLIDSFIHFNGGGIVAISSKDSSGGAKPSTSTIADTLRDKADEFDSDDDFAEKYSSIRACIMILNELNAIDGPLRLGLRFRIITKEDAVFLNAIYNKGKISDKILKTKSPHLFQLLKTASYSPDDTHPSYQTGYHLLAIIARKVAEYMNKDKKKITQFFKAVLNKSSIIQVLAYTNMAKDAISYKDFKCIFPPSFDGTIQITADNYYTSRSRPGGKISFEFKK